MIEEFFKAHQHTIAAIAAAGTVGAVITSLWLAWSARRADRTKLSAVAQVMTLFDSTTDPNTAPEFLAVSITNEGKWPLRIQANFFCWKLPVKRQYMVVVSPLDYPTEVAPRTSENFYILT
jgi:hypothetical protein